jgi:Ca2+-binding RTX toxin-like protein
MSVTTVNTTLALQRAIQTAHDGDTIQLAPGEYALDKVQNLAFAQGITITSADATHQAVLDGIYLQNDSGITFRNLEVKVDPVQGVGAIVLGGDHVTLDGLNVHGVAVGTGLGVRVLSATNVTLSNLDVHDIQGGIVIGSSDTVSVLNSKVHNLEIDAIQSAASSHVTISGNNFTNFFPKAGDHSDVIQFVGTPTAAHDITITNNIYTRGAAPAAVQGIFLGDEGARYQNVTISGNAIVGGIFQGISVFGADGLTISHNIVEGYTDQNSWMLVNGSTHVSVTDNISTYFNLTTGNVGLVSSGNVVIAQAPVGDISILGSLPPVASPPATTVPATPAVPVSPVVVPGVPIELTAKMVSYTLAVATAPAGAGQVILDPNGHTWSNSLTGGAGADTINAGGGADTLAGGAGADRFVFASAPGGVTDISDFTHGQDVIDLRGILAGVGYKGADPLADHILVLQSDGADGTKVMLDPDGVGPKAAGQILHLDHVAPSSLTVGDFGMTAQPVAVAPPAPPAPPVEITATMVNYTLAVATAPAGAAQVILDPLNNVWTNQETAGSGADTLNAGRGTNVLTGGAGADQFVFAHIQGGVSEITDFTHGQDVMDVRGVLAEVGYAGANPITDQVFVLQSDGAGGTNVMLDPDGAGPKKSDVFLHLDHVAPSTLTSSDFIFH